MTSRLEGLVIDWLEMKSECGDEFLVIPDLNETGVTQDWNKGEWGINTESIIFYALLNSAHILLA